MLITDKNIKSLIKKIQKKCESKTSKIQQKNAEASVVEEESSDKMFNEMKKLPFSE